MKLESQVRTPGDISESHSCLCKGRFDGKDETLQLEKIG